MSKDSFFKKNNISIQSIVTVGYFLLILISFISLDQYYSAFNIDIEMYLSFQDYLIPSIPVFSVVLEFIIVFYILLTSIGLTNSLSLFNNKDGRFDEDNYWQSNREHKDHNNLKNYFKIITFIIGVLLAAYLLTLLANQDFKVFWVNIAVISFTGVLIVVCILLITFKLSNIPSWIRRLSIYLLLIILGFLGFKFMNKKRIDAIKEGKFNVYYSLKTKDKTYQTNDTLMYLGQSKEYIFLFDRIKKESLIIKNANVRNTVIKQR